ncbi:MAG: hypothetical protein R3281_05845, partial [Balneolaceae bacterium]|nr:hypothetical protein [Balneolaceae bacterium]
MENNKPFHTTLYALLVAAGILLACFLVMEGWLYHVKPDYVEQAAGIEQSLNEAIRTYGRHHDQLLDNSRQLANQLDLQLQTGSARQNLYQYLQQYPSFWGATLYREQQPYVWNGFSFTRYPREHIPSFVDRDPFVNIIKQNNVVSLLCRIPIQVEDSSGTVSYELLTTRRIKQENALPIGQSHEYQLLADAGSSAEFPVRLSFFETPPDSVLGFEVLSTLSRDSVGIAYVPPGNYTQPDQQWINKVQFWRVLFTSVAFSTVALLLYLLLGMRYNWIRFLLQLFILAVAWILFTYLHIPERWLPFVAESASEQLQPILRLIRNSLFLFFVAETVVRFFSQRTRDPRPSNFLRTMLTAGLIGLISPIIITFALSESHELLNRVAFSLFDLQIFPTADSFLIFVGISLLLVALLYGLTGLYHFLLRTEAETYKVILIISSAGFVIGLLFLQLYLPDELTINWATWVTIGIFVVVLFTATATSEFYYVVSSFSVIRSVIVGSLVVGLLGYPLLEHARFNQMNHELVNSARNFKDQDDTPARDITQAILVELESELSGITQNDLDERVPFLQTTFNQTVERELTPRLQTYSFNLQLIKPDGDLVADYSTDLNAPNWTTVFDLNYLSAATEIERITKTSNRPIVQRPQLENSARYETFYRGWIPIFSPSSEEQIAWILCSVYREHPDFDKPIRAVLASLTYADWNDALLLLAYHDRKLARSSKNGLTGHFPRYNTLLPAEARALESDSVVFYTSNEFQQSYRNVLVRAGR